MQHKLTIIYSKWQQEKMGNPCGTRESGDRIRKDRTDAKPKKIIGKDGETCPCRNNTIINGADSSANTREISNIQHVYYVFQFAAFGLTTYLPTDREKTRDSGFCDPESLLYISQLAFPTSASPFQRRSPLSSGGSSPPAVAHIPLWSWRKHFWDASCHPARLGSSGPPTGGR